MQAASRGFGEDPDFDAFEAMREAGLESHWRYFRRARSADEFEHMQGVLGEEIDRRRKREAYDGWVAPMLGHMLATPEALASMVFIPGRMGYGAIRSGLGVAGVVGAFEGAAEIMRQHHDPLATPAEGFINVGATMMFAGAIGAGLGHLGARQVNRMAAQAAEEIAAAGGVARFTDRLAFGDEVAAVNRVTPQRFEAEAPEGMRDSGVYFNRDTREVVMDSGRVARSFAEGGPERLGLDPETVPNASAWGEFLIRYEVERAALARDVARPPSMWSPASSGLPRSSLRALNEALGGDGLQAAIERAALTGDYSALTSVRGIGQARAERLVTSWAEWDAAARAQGGGPAPTDGVALDRALEGYRAWRQDNRRELQSRVATAISRLADSPYKRVHRNAADRETLDLVDAIAADAYIASVGNASGRSIGASIAMEIPELTRGRTMGLYDAESAAYAAYRGLPSDPRFAGASVARYDPRGQAQAGDAQQAKMSIEEFRRAASRAWIRGERSGNEHVDRYADAIGRFYKSFEDDLHQVNLTNRPSLERRIVALEDQLARQEQVRGDVLGRAEQRGATGPQQELLVRLNREIDETAVELDLLRERSSSSATPTRSDNYFTRIWSRPMARQYPNTFKRIIREQFQRHPEGWVWKTLPDGSRRLERTKFDMSPDALNKRVDEFYNDLVAGRSWESQTQPGTSAAFARQRLLDFDNRDLIGVQLDPRDGTGRVDLIETDAQLVANTYAQRMGPAIADARRFDFGEGAEKGFEETLARTLAREGERFKGTPKQKGDHVARLERDIRSLRDRVLRRIVAEPDRLDNRAVSALRDMGHLSFMGLSAIPTLADAGKIVMAHGVSKTMGQAYRMFDADVGAQMSRLSKQEVKQAGQGADVALNLAVSRLSEVGTDPQFLSKAERLLRAGVNRFFVVNGLAPLTYGMRMFDGALRQNDLIAKALRVADGKATPDETAFLASHGIGPGMARRIAKQKWEKHPGDDFYLANTEAWSDQGAQRAFRAALSQGSENTILLASAADKPLLMEGAMHFRKGPLVDRFARKAGLREVGDYWRVQSNLMAMPFTYWNFSISATNKVLAHAVENPNRQTLVGVGVMLGLGYMASKLRFAISGNSYAWEAMSLPDKLYKTMEQSGVGGILPDVTMKAHEALEASLGTGFMPEGMSGPREATGMDAITGIAGAPASVARGLIQGGYETVMGMEGGANRLSWAAPGRNYPLTRPFYDALVDAAEGDTRPVVPGRF
jgi:hypothetical protein